ncbi:MAG: ChaN family lipoprotein [Phycisphaerales bacterium]
MRTPMAVLAAMLAAAVLPACSSAPTAGAAREWKAPIPSPVYTITQTTGGNTVTLAQLVDAAAGADVVLLGELHGQADGQAFEASFFRALLERAPRSVAALEFFERDEQVHVDDFLSGVTDEAAFAKASRRDPGNYTPGHRDIILASRDAKRPVIAANAPRRYVRIARKEGYDRLGALSPEQSRLMHMPETMPSGGYEERFIDLMAPKDEKGERSNEAGARDMFRSQALWDSTMSDSVASALRDGKGRPVVLVIGLFHVAHDGGTLQLLRAAAPGAKIVTIVMQGSDTPSEQPRADGPIADYLVKVPNEDSPEFTSSR